MRHYEIVFLVHPDQSDQVPAMIERYSDLVLKDGGAIHRVEDWGRRQLAYAINKIRKAHYVMMNVETNQSVIDELDNLFRFNDVILRNLVIRRDRAITEESSMAKARSEERETAPKETPATNDEASDKTEAAATGDSEAPATEEPETEEAGTEEADTEESGAEKSE